MCGDPYRRFEFFFLYPSFFIKPLFVLNNHPDEVDSKAVLAYGLVNKATIYQFGIVLLKVMY